MIHAGVTRTGAQRDEDVQEVRGQLSLPSVRQGLRLPAQSFGPPGVQGDQMPPADGERGAP